LKDQDADVRMEALLALGAMIPDSHSAVREILTLLNDPAPEIREVACQTLGRIGPAAKDAVPALQKRARSRDQDERTDAAWALALIAPDPETIRRAIPLVIEVLQSPAPASLRADAAMALGTFGKQSPEAHKALEAALADPKEGVRRAAKKSLDLLK
jgi:HEAT repeat protein